MTRLLAATSILVALSAPAFASTPQLPQGVTCELVRAKVAEHGKYVAWAWARLHGYSRADINEAKKCLR